MRVIALPVAVAFLFSCSNTIERGSPSALAPSNSATSAQVDTALPLNEDEFPSDYMMFEIVIADTGRNYREMEDLMHLLSRGLVAEVDSFGRTYDAQRDSIIVPLDSDDELYRGNYLPRRFSSNALSMEYLDAYMTASPGTFALISSISEDPIASDSMLTVLRGLAPRAFRIRAELFTGCMH